MVCNTIFPEHSKGSATDFGGTRNLSTCLLLKMKDS